ncbi:MAG TPA: galactokinase family protein [Gemmatimonadales bacterium]|nr:galactokinase family protein [Gemmatimonadales bacterium]
MSSARLATSQFVTSFATRAAVVASAPGRVNLIGEHTDYNGGPVLPVALERRTAVAAATAEDWRFVSSVDGVVHIIDVEGPLRRDWTDYLVGVVRELRAQGAAPSGALVAVASTVPIGAGLSSSAALTVAAARALSLLAGRSLRPADLADVAFRAEHDQVGVRCGRMDQTIAAHGERGTALLFETATGSMDRVPFEGRLWIVESGVSHKLTGGALNERRRECEEALALCRAWRPGLAHLAQLAPRDLDEAARRLPPGLIPRVRHVVTETVRTRSAAAALAAADLRTVGRLLVEGHASLRDDFASTVAEADFLVEHAVARGAFGARLTGAGWGGAVVVLAPTTHEARILAELSRAFEDRFGRVPETWSTRASAGVRREALPATAG